MIVVLELTKGLQSMMNMQSRNEYLRTLIQKRGYRLRSKKEKSKLLDEYCKNTGQNRKYVIRKIKSGKYIKDKTKLKQRKKKEYYDSYVKDALSRIWRIFDYPCGQRLEPLLKTEVDRLRKQGELECPDEVAEKLKEIKSATIDRKLAHQKEVERMNRKYHQKKNPLLYQKIPVKLSDELNRSILGNIQIDLVEHCGNSARGEYICTLSNADIATGWWEGEAIMGRGQIPTQIGLDKIRKRFPSDWREIHSDNGTEFINAHLFRYTQEENLGFSRSRPYRKNDNCFVEQKNWTHVKKYVGYQRYDTQEELRILNNLYRNELKLYKNFFQPVIKLNEKVRIGGKIHRRYDIPRTPYHRVLESKEISEKIKEELRQIYNSLNPAELKRNIDRKLDMLCKAYQQKQTKSQKVEVNKRLKPNTVTFSTTQPKEVSVT